jgi:hypothetical protein
VAVRAPAHQPPIHVTTSDAKPNALRVSAHLVSNRNTATTGTVHDESSAAFSAAHGPNSASMKWNRPDLQGGMDADYTVSSHTALMAGFSRSRVGGESFSEEYIGVGFFDRDQGVAMRADFGVNFQSVSYDATTTETGYDPVRSGGPNTFRDYFANVTMNSDRRHRVNAFFQGGASTQRLTQFGGHSSRSSNIFETTVITDLRKDTQLYWLYATPGLFFSVGARTRVILGVRASYMMGMDDANRTVFWSPVVKFDWRM